MPTYDYTCSPCQKKFTAFQSITSNPFANCPVCQKSVRRNLSGGTGIHFKGSGFYVTDYKQKKADNKDNKNSSCPKTNEKSPADNKKTPPPATAK